MSKTNNKGSNSNLKSSGTCSTSTINPDYSLQINNGSILTRDNLNELTKLPLKRAIDELFPEASTDKDKERGDVYFSVQVPNVKDSDSAKKKQKASKEVTKVVTQKIERFLISLIQDKDVDKESKEFLMDLLLAAFDQYIISVIRSNFSQKLKVLDFDDVHQSFLYGFMDSVQKFDLKHEERVRLTTFSYHYFVKEINKLTNGLSPVNINTNKKASKIKTQLLKIYNGKGEITSKDIKYIAEELETTTKNVMSVLNGLGGISLNQSLDDEDHNELLDTISDKSNLEEEYSIEETANMVRAVTCKFIEKLKEKDETNKEFFIFITRIIFPYIIESDFPGFEKYKKYLLSVTNGKPTLQNVGSIIGISAERVRQIEADIHQRYSECLKQYIQYD